jgi:hypothetical protein
VPVLLRYRQLSRALDPAVRSVVTALVAFCAWAVASAFVFPLLFRGLGIINPRYGVGDVAVTFATEGASTPLGWGLGNLGQAAYLILSLVAFLYVILSGRDSDRSVRSVISLRIMIIVVAAIALAQSIAVWNGWSFPYSFFDSNPAYSHGYENEVGGVPRVNSVFTEASYAGGFLAAAALALGAFKLRGGKASAFIILLSVVGLLLTTATTGYATIFIGGTLLFLYFARVSLQKKLPAKVLWRSTLAVLLIAGTVVALLYADAPLREAALEMTVNKAASLSFVGRISVDVYSLELLARTFGLGTGLGSNRPSSFLAYLLSNVGVIGFALFGLFIARLLKPLLAGSRLPGGGTFAMVTWMLVGLLIAESAGIPDLNWPPLWAVLIVAATMLVRPRDPFCTPLVPSQRSAPAPGSSPALPVGA